MLVSAFNAVIAVIDVIAAIVFAVIALVDVIAVIGVTVVVSFHYCLLDGWLNPDIFLKPNSPSIVIQ